MLGLKTEVWVELAAVSVGATVGIAPGKKFAVPRPVAAPVVVTEKLFGASAAMLESRLLKYVS